MTATLASVSPAKSAAPSGAAMDRRVPVDARRRWWIWAAAILALGLLGLALWLAVPRGLAVRRGDLDLVSVRAGTFRDELISRSSVAALDSVLLDAVEDGRVDAVLVRDGASVERGQLLFRMSSMQREQELMARSAEYAQQLANLSGLRAQWAANRAAQRRDLAQIEFELLRAHRAHQRNTELAQTGFVSAAALDESGDRLHQQQALLEQARADGTAELATREQSVRDMERAVEGLALRLQALRQASDAMAVRAPASGRLAGFGLQVGETVKPGARLGRIDSIGRFKLSTRIDEFYLGRIAPGLPASVEHGGKRYALTLLRIDPQVKDGRFSVELGFDADQAPAGLQSGQALDVRITLGQSSSALLLGDGPFYADSGGAWVFVLDASGQQAERRQVRLGRRAAGQIEVLGGLAPGEQVIVSSYRSFTQAQTLRLQP